MKHYYLSKDKIKVYLQTSLVSINVLIPFIILIYFLNTNEYLYVRITTGSIVVALCVIPAFLIALFVISETHDKSMCKVENAFNYIYPSCILAFIPLCKLMESNLSLNFTKWQYDQIISAGIVLFIFMNAIFAYRLNPLYRRWNGKPIPKCFRVGSEFLTNSSKSYRVVSVSDEGVTLELTLSHFNGREFVQAKTEESMKWVECELFYRKISVMN